MREEERKCKRKKLRDRKKENENAVTDRREAIDDLRSTDLVRSSSDEEASFVMVFQRADLRRLIFWASTVFLETQQQIEGESECEKERGGERERQRESE